MRGADDVELRGRDRGAGPCVRDAAGDVPLLRGEPAGDSNERGEHQSATYSA